MRNFDTGVFATGDNVALSSLVVSGSSFAGVVDAGGSAKLTSVTASGNGTDGIAVFGDSASITSAAASGNGAIGIEAGVQFPLYRDVGPLFPKDRYRFTVNFAYFF